MTKISVYSYFYVFDFMRKLYFYDSKILYPLNGSLLKGNANETKKAKQLSRFTNGTILFSKNLHSDQ